MFEGEAELGSDNEDKDFVRKRINKNDQEENEEGLDSDLDDFVVKADDEEVGAEEEAAYQKYLADIHLDDQKRKHAEMQAVIYGRNKKRKRGDVFGEEADDFDNRKRERILERQKEQGLLNSQEEENYMKQLQEGGLKKAREDQIIKQMAEEDDMSEEEIKRQMENIKFQQFLREQKKNQIKEFEKRQQEIEDQLADQIIDLNQDNLQKSKTQNEASLKELGSTQSKSKQLPFKRVVTGLGGLR